MVYSHWAIKSIWYEITATGYIVTITTNHPCHLWMRWTNITPVIHHHLSPERGASFDISTRYCFVGYHDNEQEEDGDTYEHTFIKEPWPVCETRWFYFIGQVSAGSSASDTAIFIKHRHQPPITSYFYSDAHPEVTSVDGRAFHAFWDGLTWVELRAGVGTGSDDDSDNLTVDIYGARTTDKFYMLARVPLLFDTSIIEAGRTILNAKLRLGIWGVVNADDYPHYKLALVSSNPNSNTAIAPSDYTRFGSSLLSNDLAPITGHPFPDGYFTFEFNSLGKASITKGGITKLGIREHYYDILGYTPPWLGFHRGAMEFYSAEYVDPNRRPRLEVTYE